MNEDHNAYADRMRLDGKTAIVTGAASGIGRETALLFARRGALVLGVDKDATALDRVASAANAQGHRVEPFAIDLTTEDAPGAVFSYCFGKLGRPNILANIAGRGNDKSILETTDEDLDYFYDLNLKTAFRMSREAVRHFGTDGAAIVNTSSAVALVGIRSSAPYSAAKAAVGGLTRQMAADYGRRNIRVNAVAPGLVQTPATEARILDKVFEDSVTKSRPLPRVGTPLDIANAFVFLASDEASFITGVVLPVCGGWSTTRFRAPD
ncbi:meso-butanediol dehydrogenase/(S,S)-butanediol dehydrogenase/diacetyl reductase [Bradyrhizobium sp. USDA 4463]